MDFLDRVDFENHDGVYLSMLNDVARNQFYDQVLTQVRDHDCVEIGFGTGLLSMLALKICVIRQFVAVKEIQ
jgi:predicted RNA methylase